MDGASLGVKEKYVYLFYYLPLHAILVSENIVTELLHSAPLPVCSPVDSVGGTYREAFELQGCFQHNMDHGLHAVDRVA